MSHISQKFVRCRRCDETLMRKNLARHIARRHRVSDDGQRTRDSSRESLESRSTCTSHSREFQFIDPIPSADLVRSASLCMLRKTEGVNAPDMEKYLKAYFPEIPSNYRQPLIACTFAVAQKVSAVHVDTLIGDAGRTSWAKRSLGRWLHGLSAIESYEEDRVMQRADPEPDLLSDKELPVPFDSNFLQSDMAVMVQLVENDLITDPTPRLPSSSVESATSQAVINGILQATYVEENPKTPSVSLISADTEGVAVSEGARAMGSVSAPMVMAGVLQQAKDKASPEVPPSALLSAGDMRNPAASGAAEGAILTRSLTAPIFRPVRDDDPGAVSSSENSVETEVTLSASLRASDVISTHTNTTVNRLSAAKNIMPKTTHKVSALVGPRSDVEASDSCDDLREMREMVTSFNSDLALEVASLEHISMPDFSELDLSCSDDTFLTEGVRPLQPFLSPIHMSSKGDPHQKKRPVSVDLSGHSSSRHTDVAEPSEMKKPKPKSESLSKQKRISEKSPHANSKVTSAMPRDKELKRDDSRRRLHKEPRQPERLPYLHSARRDAGSRQQASFSRHRPTPGNPPCYWRREW